MREQEPNLGKSAEKWVSRIIPVALVVLIGWLFFRLDSEKPSPSENVMESHSRSQSVDPSVSVPGDMLLADYGDPSTAPIEDLKKLHRVITGYFSVIKDSSRFPIGGNADMAAALRGENANREVFIRPGHKIFSQIGNLIDRWGTDLHVHPEAWRRIELRSAGPDRIPYNGDDILLAPGGFERAAPSGE
jgi:hypothetical protein